MLSAPVRWYVGQRVTPAVLALYTVGAMATPWVGGQELPVPRLVPGAIRYAEFLPSLSAAAVVASVVSPPHLVPEARSPRSPGRWERWWVVVLLAMTGLVWALGHQLLDGQPGLLVVAVRDLLGFTGLGLIARALGWGPYAPALSVLFALVATVLGYPGQWLLHWPMEPAESFGSMVVCVALVVVGLCWGTGQSALHADAIR